MSSSDIFGLNWGYATSTLRWIHTFGPRFFSNTSLIYSYYDYKLRINNNGSNFNVLSKLRDLNVKEELQFYLNPRNNIRAGFNTVYHTLTPGVLTGGEKSGVNDTSFQKRYGLESGVFISNTWKASDKWNITYGGRLSIFNTMDSAQNFKKTYINPEARLAISYQLNESASIKASYVDNAQNMHLISSTNAGFPTDQWVVSNSFIKPERSHQVSLGYYRNFTDNKYELTFETYYKALDKQIDYK